MPGNIPEDVTGVFLLCRYERLHGSYLLTLCTTFLPLYLQLIDYQLVKHSASAISTLDPMKSTQTFWLSMMMQSKSSGIMNQRKTAV